MAVTIGTLNQPQLYNYQYDQLNRIVGMDVYRGLNTASNSWSAISLTTDYQERIAYDANGNILKYLRNGTTAGSRPLEMDSLNYAYNRDGSGNLTDNRLRHVKDSVGATNYLKEDIDNQGNDNYSYDEIGNLIGDTQAGVYNIKWNVYGKIKSLNRTTEIAVDTNSGSTTVEAVYHYDANGNRIGKIEGRYPGPHKATWYVRDAQGNVMAVYEKVAWGIAEGQAKLTEHHVYGSSRLGIIKRDQDIDQPKETAVNIDLLGPTYLSNFKRGNKFFELSNHLGNVLVTVSDKHSGVDTSSDGEYDYYQADVVSASDYYPFGMQMVGRVSESAKYRYGFNGKEKDPEVMGEGNVYDYGFRIYNPRVGRFLSVDPLMKSFPWFTPYQFAGNKPVNCIDLDGMESRVAIFCQRSLEPTINKIREVNVFEKAKNQSLIINFLVPLLHIPGYKVGASSPITVNPEYKDLNSYEKDDIVRATVSAFLSFKTNVEKNVFLENGLNELNYYVLHTVADFDYNMLKEEIGSQTLDELVSKVKDLGTIIEYCSDATSKLEGVATGFKVLGVIDDISSENYVQALNEVSSYVVEKIGERALAKAIKAKIITEFGAKTLKSSAQIITLAIEPVEGAPNVDDFNQSIRANLRNQTIAAMLFFFINKNELQKESKVLLDEKAKKELQGWPKQDVLRSKDGSILKD